MCSNSNEANTPPVCEVGEDRPAHDTHTVSNIAPRRSTNQVHKAGSSPLDVSGGTHATAPSVEATAAGPAAPFYGGGSPPETFTATRGPLTPRSWLAGGPVGMPTKARGYWFCEYCPASFDTADEAEEHERVDCLRNPRSTASTAFAYPPPSQPQQPPVMPPQLLPPPQHYPYYEEVPQHPPPHAVMAQQQQPQRISPRAAEAPRPMPPPLRRYPLMDEPSRRSSPSRDYATRLVPGDLVACRHLELIETVDASSSSPQSSAAASITTTQVGLRCRSCGDSTRISELSLPRAIRFLADAIRRLADQHLTTCPSLPDEERQVLEEACRRRRELHRRRDEHQQRADEVPSREASPDAAAWRVYERDRQLLVDFCTSRCHEVGIVNRAPENSGMVFREPSPASSSAASEDPYGGALLSSSSSSTRREAGTNPNVHPSPPQPGYPGHRPSPPTAAALRGSHSGSRGGEGIQQQQQRPSPTSPADAAGYYHEQGPPAPPYPYEMVSSSFPYYHELDGSWHCKYCSHVHPDYRETNWRWLSPSGAPPPPDFIDHHLHLCRHFHESLQPPPPTPYHQDQASPHAYQQSRAMADFGPPPPHMPYGQQPHQQQSPPYPSPHPPSQHLVAFPHPPPSWDPSLAAHRGGSPMGSPRRDLHPSPYLVAPESMAAGGSMAQTPRSVPIHDPRAEMTAQRAIEYLSSTERHASGGRRDSPMAGPEPDLVQNEDKLLLTDFLFYLMKQLQIVRFSESDRKTRGGKREKINIGFGGLECIHCRDTVKARKFYWSGVDRLANSFAEIPAHVFKCSSCPDEVKEALTNLKKVHAEQMARLPRGSQKVFFRRVWKRLHDRDPVSGSPEQPEHQFGDQPSPASEAGFAAAASSPRPEGGSPGSKQQSPEGTSGSEESMFTVDRPTKDSAKALADAAMHSLPPSPSSRVLLGIAEDRDFLSDVDCFLRRQLEVFCATKEDVKTALQDRRFPIKEGQVGIRCVHCALANQGSGASGHAVAYPFSITGIFEAVREFQRLHLDYCENLPAATRSKIVAMKESTTITSIQRKYYALAARGLGLKDTKEGIRAGSEAVPVVSQAVFAFDQDPELSPDRRRVPRHGSSPFSEYGSPVAATDRHDPDSRKRHRQEGSAESPSDDFSLKPPPGYGRRGSGGGPTNY